MAKFRVGDKVRVTHDLIEFCEKYDGRVGVVISDKNPHGIYPYLVQFDGGAKREFCDEELALVAPADEGGEVIASGRITYDFNAFTPAVLVGDTSLHAALRKFASDGADVEIVVRKKGA